MKAANIFTWAALVALTLISFYFSESSFTGFQLALVIMGIVFIKFVGIGFQFMELKDANTGWKVLFVGFIFIFSLLVVFIV